MREKKFLWKFIVLFYYEIVKIYFLVLWFSKVFWIYFIILILFFIRDRVRGEIWRKGIKFFIIKIVI